MNDLDHSDQRRFDEIDDSIIAYAQAPISAEIAHQRLSVILRRPRQARFDGFTDAGLDIPIQRWDILLWDGRAVNNLEHAYFQTSS